MCVRSNVRLQERPCQVYSGTSVFLTFSQSFILCLFDSFYCHHGWNFLFQNESLLANYRLTLPYCHRYFLLSYIGSHSFLVGLVTDFGIRKDILERRREEKTSRDIEKGYLKS